MSIDLNDEITQDFLVEAGEILDQLGEQLLELEQKPDDYDLLNAIFRAFHTVKGGAGFINIDPLVDICHKAEDVFNVLRQGDRIADADLMDVVLQVLDNLYDMLNDIRSGEMPKAADQEILNKLLRYVGPEDNQSTEHTDITQGGQNTPETPQHSATESNPASVENTAANRISMDGIGESISEEEYEELLERMDGTKTQGNIDDDSKKATPSSEISDDEFEELLDQLHGKGCHNGVASSKDSEGGGQTTNDKPNSAVASTKSNDLITDEEFESLLDDIHGPGKKPSIPDGNQSAGQSKQLNSKTPARNTDHSESPSTIDSKDKDQAVSSAQRQPAPKTPPKSNPKATESTVRVDTQRLDQIMNLVGELVLVRNRFETLKAFSQDEKIAKAVANLDVVTSDLQLAVMKTRMQPIKKVFGRFPRVVRDLARSLNKEVRLEMMGEETDLDKNLVEALADPLIHLVRNSIDHGIETPEERIAAGKPREGTVVLGASQQGDHIELTIIDDGKGMNAEALRQKVVEKGLMDAELAARLDDSECYNLIFLPGFSTKSEISDVSGRGVGMDVVKTRVAQMNGQVEIESSEGQGTRLVIKVPLTLAILPTLMVKLESQAFAFPLASVVEILDLDLRNINIVDGQSVVMVRERALPIFYLKEWLIESHQPPLQEEAIGHVVVINVGGKHVGFVVDHLIGQEEVVIKPLGAKLQGLPGLAGATITGDGIIALILDLPSLMTKYAA